MNETQLATIWILAFTNTFLFAWLVLKVTSYLDWKRTTRWDVPWRESSNARR